MNTDYHPKVSVIARRQALFARLGDVISDDVAASETGDVPDLAPTVVRRVIVLHQLHTSVHHVIRRIQLDLHWLGLFVRRACKRGEACAVV